MGGLGIANRAERGFVGWDGSPRALLGLIQGLGVGRFGDGAGMTGEGEWRRGGNLTIGREGGREGRTLGEFRDLVGDWVERLQKALKVATGADSE